MPSVFDVFPNLRQYDDSLTPSEVVTDTSPALSQSQPQPSALAAKFPSLANLIDGSSPSDAEIMQGAIRKRIDHNPSAVVNDEMADPQSRMTAAVRAMQSRENTDPLYYPKKIPFVGGALAARENMDAANALERIKGSNGSAQDYYDAARFLKMHADRGDWGTLERIGDGVLGSGSFAVELFTTAGASTAARKAAEGAVTKSLPNLATRGVGVGTELAAQVALNPQRSVENITGRIAQGEGTGTAILNGIGDTAVEYGTEMAGRGLAKALPFKWANPKAGSILAKAGVQGLPSEFAEERIGDIVRGTTGLADDYGTTGQMAQGNFQPAAEELAVLGAMQGGGQILQNAGGVVSAEKMAQRIDEILSDPAQSASMAASMVNSDPAKAATLASNASPSRKQWEEAGMPRGASAAQRKAFAAQLQAALTTVNRDTNPDTVTGQEQVAPDVAPIATQATPPASESQPAAPDPRWKSREQYQAEQDTAQQQVVAAANALTQDFSSEPTPSPLAETQDDMQVGEVQEATQPQEAVTPAADKPKVTGFTTSKGSAYELDEQGRTTRTKTPHEGHDPKDVGVKEKSAVTVYVNPEFAREIGMWQTSNATNKRVFVDGKQVVLVSSAYGKPLGSDGKSTFSTEPQVGLSPLELWQPDQNGLYRGNHPGNEITEIRTAAPVETATQEPQPKPPTILGRRDAATLATTAQTEKLDLSTQDPPPTNKEPTKPGRKSANLNLSGKTQSQEMADVLRQQFESFGKQDGTPEEREQRRRDKSTKGPLPRPVESLLDKALSRNADVRKYEVVKTLLASNPTTPEDIEDRENATLVALDFVLRERFQESVKPQRDNDAFEQAILAAELLKKSLGEQMYARGVTLTAGESQAIEKQPQRLNARNQSRVEAILKPPAAHLWDKNGRLPTPDEIRAEEERRAALQATPEPATAPSPEPPPRKIRPGRLTDAEMQAIKTEERRKALTASRDEAAPKEADLLPPSVASSEPRTNPQIDAVVGALGGMVEDMSSGPYSQAEQAQIMSAWLTIRTMGGVAGSSEKGVLDAPPKGTDGSDVQRAAQYIRDRHAELKPRWNGWTPQDEDATALAAQPSVAPQSTMPDAESSETNQQRKMPSINDHDLKHLRPLSDFSDTLYREVGGSSLSAYLPGSNISDEGEFTEVFVATNPDFATGQGSNKGAMLEFDSEGLQGKLWTAKPSWQFSYQNGDAELVARDNRQGKFQKSLKSITIKPDLQLSRLDRIVLQRNIAQLESQGWTKETLEGGVIKYSRPDSQPSVKPATKLGRVSTRTVTPKPLASEPVVKRVSFKKPPATQSDLTDEPVRNIVTPKEGVTMNAVDENRQATDDASVYQQAIADANSDPEMNGYNAALRGLDSVLKSKELPTRPKDYGESSKDFPYLWELSGLFHNPLASMTGKESLDQVVSAIAAQHKTNENTGRSELRDIQSDSGVLRNAYSNTPAQTKAEIERDRRSGGMSNTRQIETARKEANGYRRKAEIMQALGIDADGYTDLADKLDKAAQSKEDRINKLYEEATAREKQAPLDNAKKITPLADHKATIVKAWDGNVTGDDSGFVSDGRLMITEDALSVADLKKLRGRRSEGRNKETNVPKDLLAKVWKDTAKPKNTADLIGVYPQSVDGPMVVVDTGADFLYYNADKVAYVAKATGATEYAINPREKGNLAGGVSLVFMKNNRPVAVLASNSLDVSLDIDRDTALSVAKSFPKPEPKPKIMGRKPATKPAEASAAQQAREEADAAQKQADRDAVENPVNATGFLGLPTTPQRPRNNAIPDAIKADNPEVERQLAGSEGVTKETVLHRIAQAAPLIGKMATRAQEYIPNSPKWAADNEAFRLLKAIPNAAQDEATRTVASVVDGLGPQPLQLFSRKVIIDNLLESVRNGQPRRFGFESEQEIADYQSKLDALVAQSPEVQKALQTRKGIVRELVQDLVDADLLDASALDSADTYFHQQVLSKFEESRKATGAGPKQTKAGFQKSRTTGVEAFDEALNYNTSYVESEFEWMRDAQIKLRTDKWLKGIAARHDIIDQVKATAKAGDTNWRQDVRESGTHQVWQAEFGNVFYPAIGVDEQVVADVMRGVFDTAEVSADDLKQLIVMGGRRKEMVLPNEIADQLNAVQARSKKGPIGKLAKEILDYWKVWTLMQPLRAAGYNARNITGDLDPIMGGAIGVLNPKLIGKSFAELQGYYGTLGKTQALSLSPELTLARDLGVIDSSMASEIPDLKDLQVFQRLYSGQPKSLLGLSKSYFDTVKKYSTFRENIARYAAFLYYRDALAKGTLSHYGGARKDIIDQLSKDMGTDVAAAHLARNLLGDYGDLTVMGDWLRKYAMPFHSWTEVNMKRYPRIIYNAGAHGTRKFGRGPVAAAAGIGAVAMVALPYVLMQAYNNLVWGDEEEKLSDDERASPHLILGKHADGSLVILRNVGALGDVLEWFGINTLVGRSDDIQSGQMSVGDVAQEAGKGVVNKAMQGIRPDVKSVFELSTGKSTFPDVFNPRSVRRDDQVAGYFGLTDVYRGARGGVMQDGSRIRPHFTSRLLGLTHPGRNAMFEISELRDRYMKKNGSGGFVTNIYFANMRDAASAGDIDAFKEARQQWLTQPSATGDYNKFKEAIKRLDPLSEKMSDEKEADFTDNYLTAAQKDKLRLARDYSGQLQVDMWKMWQVAAEQDTGPVAEKIRAQRMDEAMSNVRTLLHSMPTSDKDLSPTDRKNKVTLGNKQRSVEEAARQARAWIRDSGLPRTEVKKAVKDWIDGDLTTQKGRDAKYEAFLTEMGW